MSQLAVLRTYATPASLALASVVSANTPIECSRRASVSAVKGEEQQRGWHEGATNQHEHNRCVQESPGAWEGRATPPTPHARLRRSDHRALCGPHVGVRSHSDGGR